MGIPNHTWGHCAKVAENRPLPMKALGCPSALDGRHAPLDEHFRAWVPMPAASLTDSGCAALISLIIKRCKTSTYFKGKQAMEFRFQNCFENIKSYSSGKVKDFYKLL